MILGHQVPGGPIVPLVLKMDVCETLENIERNLRSALGRDYVRLNEFLGSKSGPASIVGFGPSLKDTYNDLVGDVMACNGAHDFLIEKGIVPKYAMLFDAAEVMNKFLTPHPEVTYFIASRCHPSIFEMLKGFKVVVWHVKGDEGIDELLDEYNKPEPMVHGGSAAVTRGMFLLRALGYTTLHLFGADSSYEGEFTHVKKSIVEEQEFMVYCDHKWWKTTPWLCGQVEDLKILAPEMKESGIDLVVHGTGLLPHVAHVIGLPTPNYLG